MDRSDEGTAENVATSQDAKEGLLSNDTSVSQSNLHMKEPRMIWIDNGNMQTAEERNIFRKDWMKDNMDSPEKSSPAVDARVVSFEMLSSRHGGGFVGHTNIPIEEVMK